MESFSELSLKELIREEGFDCTCGKHHSAAPLKFVAVEPGGLNRISEALDCVEKKHPFLIMGPNSREVAGKKIMSLLDASGIEYASFCFHPVGKILPNEEAMAQIEEAFHPECDFILGIGSGVINDLCKMIAKKYGLESGIVATAPSMDGYASNSAAMELAGIKTTVYTSSPTLILCDTEVIRNAPYDMICSGFGDMAAKLISIADWRIARLITGEYYCDRVAQLMLDVCGKIIGSVKELQKREEPAIREMMNGLILSGIAMSFAVVSRPASGMEHTISHLLEMFALAQGRQPASHGIQVGYGTRIALKLYRAAERFQPSAEIPSLDEESWEAGMKAVFGDQAETLIRQAAEEERNTPEAIGRRRANAIAHWSEIKEVISSVTSAADRLEAALDEMEIPRICEYRRMNFSGSDIENAVMFSRDLRERYIFTSMCFDIGMTDYRSCPVVADLTES